MRYLTLSLLSILGMSSCTQSQSPSAPLASSSAQSSTVISSSVRSSSISSTSSSSQAPISSLPTLSSSGSSSSPEISSSSPYTPSSSSQSSAEQILSSSLQSSSDEPFSSSTTTSSTTLSSSMKSSSSAMPIPSSSSINISSSSLNENSSSFGLSSEEGSSSSTPCSDFTPTSSTMCDLRDGQIYATVEIDGDTWLAQNMNYQSTSLSMCYNDDEQNCEKYGRLYPQGSAYSACPEGWHLPSRTEWADFLKGKSGTGLKSTAGWASGSNGSNSYGFDVKGAGYCPSKFQCMSETMNTVFWTSTTYSGSSSHGYVAEISYKTYTEQGYITRGTYSSVRCLKNK